MKDKGDFYNCDRVLLWENLQMVMLLLELGGGEKLNSLKWENNSFQIRILSLRCLWYMWMLTVSKQVNVMLPNFASSFEILWKYFREDIQLEGRTFRVISVLTFGRELKTMTMLIILQRQYIEWEGQRTNDGNLYNISISGMNREKTSQLKWPKRMLRRFNKNYLMWSHESQGRGLLKIMSDTAK